MVDISIDTKEVDAWVNNQSNRDRARGYAMVMMKNKLVEMVKKAIEGHSSTGELSSSVIGESSPEEIAIYSKVYGDIILEYGRKPGKMPPVEALRQWASDKLGDPSLAYLVARSIARKGTQKYRDKAPKELTMLIEEFEKDFMDKELDKLLNEYTE